MTSLQGDIEGVPADVFEDQRLKQNQPLREVKLYWPPKFQFRGPGLVFGRTRIWPWPTAGSTHEFIFNVQEGLKAPMWVTAPAHDAIARVASDGSFDTKFFKFPLDSLPHGIVFDKLGQLWVCEEGKGKVVRVDTTSGKIVAEIDILIYTEGEDPVNPHPHGLGIGHDGLTLWFTGKATSSVGRINPRVGSQKDKDRSVEHFPLPTLDNAKPIFIMAGPEQCMWCTELEASRIARITTGSTVKITEYVLPTANSRPIAVIPGPDGKTVWVSEEAGGKIARIDMQGNITEFPVPLTQKNMLVASLAFDKNGNLWTQIYVDPNNPQPEGRDSILKYDQSISDADDLFGVPLTIYPVQSRDTIMHRIKQGPDGNIWFTELGQDKICRLRDLD